jgi:hypothetical protein
VRAARTASTAFAFQSSATCADTGDRDALTALTCVVAAANAVNMSAAARNVREAFLARVQLIFPVVIV